MLKKQLVEANKELTEKVEDLTAIIEIQKKNITARKKSSIDLKDEIEQLTKGIKDAANKISLLKDDNAALNRQVIRKQLKIDSLPHKEFIINAVKTYRKKRWYVRLFTKFPSTK